MVSTFNISMQTAVFLNGAFLKKRFDYSHGFSSVFFDTPEVTKIVLPKNLQNFKKTPNSTRWPKELNQKVFFPFFPRNIQYRAKLKAPFQFFRQCATFRKKNPPPFNFLMFCNNGCWKIRKGPPFSALAGIWRASSVVRVFRKCFATLFVSLIL